MTCLQPVDRSVGRAFERDLSNQYIPLTLELRDTGGSDVCSVSRSPLPLVQIHKTEHGAGTFLATTTYAGHAGLVDSVAQRNARERCGRAAAGRIVAVPRVEDVGEVEGEAHRCRHRCALLCRRKRWR